MVGGGTFIVAIVVSDIAASARHWVVTAYWPRRRPHDGVAVTWFECPYLGGRVEFTGERERHVRRRHREVVGDGLTGVRLTLLDPDAVYRRLWRPTELLFWKAFDEPTPGKQIVVVTVEEEPSFERPDSSRHWVATLTKRPPRRTENVYGNELEV